MHYLNLVIVFSVYKALTFLPARWKEFLSAFSSWIEKLWTEIFPSPKVLDIVNTWPDTSNRLCIHSLLKDGMHSTWKLINRMPKISNLGRKKKRCRARAMNDKIALMASILQGKIDTLRKKERTSETHINNIKETIRLNVGGIAHRSRRSCTTEEHRKGIKCDS